MHIVNASMLQLHVDRILFEQAIEHDFLPLFHDDSACLTSKFMEHASVYFEKQTCHH